MKKRKLSGMEFNNNCYLKRKKNKNNDIPPYQIQIAAQSFSNIASVLSGFALTLIFLVFQIPNLGKDQKTITFIAMTLSVAFIGLVLTSLVFATLSGDEDATSRSHTIGFLGGTGYVITVNLLLVSLSAILKESFSGDAYKFIHDLFFITMIATPIFSLFSSVDSYFVLNKEYKNMMRNICFVYITSIFWFPILNYFKIVSVNDYDSFFVHPVLRICLTIIFISSIISLIISTYSNSRFHFSKSLIYFITFVDSIVVSMLTILL